MKDEKMKVEDVDDKCAMMNLPKFDGTSSGYSRNHCIFSEEKPAPYISPYGKYNQNPYRKISSYISIYGIGHATTLSLIQTGRKPKPQDIPQMQGELEGLWALIEAAEANQDGSTRDSSGILQRAHYGGVDLVRIGEYIDFLETQLGRITKQRLAKIDPPLERRGHLRFMARSKRSFKRDSQTKK